MSEEKKQKWLHQFEVDRTVKEEVSEDGKDEKGEAVKITKTIDKKTPTKFFLKSRLYFFKIYFF